MAFDLETIKTRITDFLHTLAADLGPYVDRFKNEFHTVAAQVHQQALADEEAAKHTVAGAVQTIESQVEQDATTAGAAVKADTSTETGK